MPDATSRPDDDEARRIARLRELVVLDSPPEEMFDSIARMASEVCGVPIALVSLIDAERQWFKANVGLPGVNETDRHVAFCNHTIRNDGLLEVADATADPRFAANPFVTGEADKIRFYAGAPLVMPGGERVGTLCVIDREAHQLDARQASMLRWLAKIASQALVMRQELISKSLAVRSEYERSLAASEAQHRSLVEEQTELISLAAPDGRLIYVNPAYARHFGREPSQMVGASLYDYIDPAHREAVRERLAEALRTGQTILGENRMTAADGSERWVAWANRPQHDGNGQLLLHSVGRDVTDRKATDEALRASQAFLLRTGEIAGVGGWELDIARNTITWSEQTRRIHEAAPDYVPTTGGLIGFYAPEARPAVEAAAQRALQHGEPWDMELPFVTATGRPIWVRSMGSVDMEDGKPVRLVGAFQDITERTATQAALRALTMIFDNTTDYVVQTDARGNVIYMNPATRRVIGLGPDEPVTQRNFADFNTAATRDLFASTIMPAVQAHGVWLGETTVYAAGRRVMPVSHMVIAHRDPAGRVTRYSAVMRDISAEQEARQQLRRQTATLRSVTEAIPAMISVVGADGRYRFVNSSFERWAGAQRDQIIGHTLAEVLGRADSERNEPWVDRVLAGETVSFERDYPERSRARHLAMSFIPLWLETGDVDGFVSVAQDITQHKQEEVRLLQLSQRDALTGLLNRSGFEHQMDRAMQAGDGPTLALLYIDLDHFKPVNDRHGHPVGDQVLQMFGARLRSLVRPSDAVARLGGDEFAMLLIGVRRNQNAHQVAEKVLSAAHAPFEVGTLSLNIGASVGVAYGADPATGWRELVARADAMLYKAKAAGRGQQVGEPPAAP
jgi:diguanylate cyclase (GGDEF)-like protein/PAS domain S-box-containing protein